MTFCWRCWATPTFCPPTAAPRVCGGRPDTSRCLVARRRVPRIPLWRAAHRRRALALLDSAALGLLRPLSAGGPQFLTVLHLIGDAVPEDELTPVGQRTGRFRRLPLPQHRCRRRRRSPDAPVCSGKIIIIHILLGGLQEPWFHLLTWPSGLRRETQVLFHVCGRGFEPHCQQTCLRSLIFVHCQHNYLHK